jgi:hypothetical protein
MCALILNRRGAALQTVAGSVESAPSERAVLRTVGPVSEKICRLMDYSYKRRPNSTIGHSPGMARLF